MRIALLGPPAVSTGEEPSRLAGVKQHALLALLALNAGRAVPADRLIDGLWAEGGPRDAANALQHQVSRLRVAVGGDRVVRRGSGYALDDYLRFAAYLNPDLPLAVAFDDARGTAERWGTIPRTFVRLSEDHTIPPALQDRMIAEADAATPRNVFDVRTLPSSHSPFASMPERLAGILAV